MAAVPDDAGSKVPQALVAALQQASSDVDDFVGLQRQQIDRAVAAASARLAALEDEVKRLRKDGAGVGAKAESIAQREITIV